MKKFCILAMLLAVAACGSGDILAISSDPVARLQINKAIRDDPGSQLFCGVDTSGRLPENRYADLQTDAVVVGHKTIGADDRCVEDQLTQYNASAAFDLSDLAVARRASPAGIEVTGGLLTARIENAPDFSGGSIGCRLTGSSAGVGMLDSIVWTRSETFLRGVTPDLAVPPEAVWLGSLRISGREVPFQEYMRGLNDPFSLAVRSRNAITAEFDGSTLAALQEMVDEDAPLDRFFIYFAGTNAGATSENQTCITHVTDLDLTVFYKAL